MQVVVDNLLTNYATSGLGQTLLFLHGWGDNLYGMKALQSSLDSEYKVISLDLPGFGNTQAPASAWGLDDYANFVAKFLKKIKAEPLLAIIAHSNGGAIAIRGLSTSRLSSKKCVLLASAGIRGSYKGRIKLIRVITKAGKLLSSPLPKAAKNKLRREVYKTVGSDMLVAENLQETFKKIVTDDVLADAAKINIPTLLIYAENDSQVPLIYGRQFHEAMTNSTLEIISQAGHFVHLDQPGQVTKLIKDFLK